MNNNKIYQTLVASYLWYMMTETVLPVAEHAKLSERQHRRFTLDKTTNAVSLHDGADQGVEVVLWSSGSGDVTGAGLCLLSCEENGNDFNC